MIGGWTKRSGRPYKDIDSYRREKNNYEKVFVTDATTKAEILGAVKDINLVHKELRTRDADSPLIYSVVAPLEYGDSDIIGRLNEESLNGNTSVDEMVYAVCERYLDKLREVDDGITAGALQKIDQDNLSGIILGHKDRYQYGKYTEQFVSDQSKKLWEITQHLLNALEGRYTRAQEVVYENNTEEPFVYKKPDAGPRASIINLPGGAVSLPKDMTTEDAIAAFVNETSKLFDEFRIDTPNNEIALKEDMQHCLDLAKNCILNNTSLPVELRMFIWEQLLNEITESWSIQPY